tara:strand:+ start:290 stop:475 length:186 start_codon:yes stop_codon:yes gene_type:complete
MLNDTEVLSRIKKHGLIVHTKKTKIEYGRTWDTTYTLCYVFDNKNKEWVEKYIKTNSFCNS